jgi:hypothetical protein
MRWLLWASVLALASCGAAPSGTIGHGQRAASLPPGAAPAIITQPVPVVPIVPVLPPTSPVPVDPFPPHNEPDLPGVCHHLTHVADCSERPVCGCDGMPYTGPCEAVAATHGIGTCLEPAVPPAPAPPPANPAPAPASDPNDDP